MCAARRTPSRVGDHVDAVGGDAAIDAALLLAIRADAGTFNLREELQLDTTSLFLGCTCCLNIVAKCPFSKKYPHPFPDFGMSVTNLGQSGFKCPSGEKISESWLRHSFPPSIGEASYRLIMRILIRYID